MTLWVAAIKVRYHPAKFGGDSLSGSGLIMILICHLISQDHVIKGSCGFMGGSPLWYVTTLLSLVAIGIVEVEIYF